MPNNNCDNDKELIIFLKKTLRKISYRWKPIYNTKTKNRRHCKPKKKNQKYEYKCNQCGGYFRSGLVQVHHIVPVGSLETIEEVVDFMRRLFCTDGGLELLCLGCHKKRH